MYIKSKSDNTEAGKSNFYDNSYCGGIQFFYWLFK
jgi:hypothetical protein